MPLYENHTMFYNEEDCYHLEQLGFLVVNSVTGEPNQTIEGVAATMEGLKYEIERLRTQPAPVDKDDTPADLLQKRMARNENAERAEKLMQVISHALIK